MTEVRQNYSTGPALTIANVRRAADAAAAAVLMSLALLVTVLFLVLFLLLVLPPLLLLLSWPLNGSNAYLKAEDTGVYEPTEAPKADTGVYAPAAEAAAGVHAPAAEAASGIGSNVSLIVCVCLIIEALVAYTWGQRLVEPLVV